MTERHFRLLVLEDNQAHIKLMQNSLAKIKKIDFYFLSTINSTDTFLKNRYCDLILSTIDLSDGDASAFFLTRGVHKKIPVILFAGDDEDIKRAVYCVRQGFYDYRLKTKEVLKSVDVILNKAMKDLWTGRGTERENADGYMVEGRRVMNSGIAERCDERLEIGSGQTCHQVTKTPAREKDGKAEGLSCSSPEIERQKKKEFLLSSLLHFSQMAGKVSTDKLLGIALEKVEQLTGSQLGYFHLLETDSETGGLQGMPDGALAPSCHPRHGKNNLFTKRVPAWADCILGQKPIIHNEFNSELQKEDLWPDQAEIGRDLMVPVFENEAVAAVLIVAGKTEDYTDDDAAIASKFMNMAWHTVSREESREESFEAYCQLQSLVDSFPGIVYRCTNDHGWTMEYISKGCLKLTGYDRYSLINSRLIAFADIIHPDHQDRIWDEIQDAIESGHPFELEYPIVCKDRTEKWVWEWGQLAPVEGTDASILEGFIMEINLFNRN